MWSTWNFIKNNRKTIILTGAAVTGFIGIRKYFSNFQRQWEQSQSRNFVSEVHKKGTYFDEALCIGNGMVNKQYQQIITKIQQLFKIEQILDQIKEAKDNHVPATEQLKFYEKLKLEIFAYIVAEVYAITFFITYLRVQLSMISGVMYYDNQVNQANNGSSDSSSLLKDSTSRYHMFISLIENFQHFGTEHIVQSARQVVATSFGSMKVTDKVTLKNVLSVFDQIKENLFSQFDRLIEENASIVFCANREQSSIPDDLNTKSRVAGELKAYQKMVDEMLDIVKLSDFRKVIENCFNIGFSNLYDFISECFVQFDEQQQESQKSQTPRPMVEKRQFINPHQIVIPLLRLLPLIWMKVNSTQEEEPSPANGSMEFTDRQKNRNALLVQYLLCSDSLTCFTANIYEAFCNENDINRNN